MNKIEDKNKYMSMLMISILGGVIVNSGFGFISYIIVKIAKGKIKEINPLLFVIVALFVVMYVLAGLQDLKII